MASVKASLALVYESMDNVEQTEAMARDACNTLVPLEHPDAAEALFALSRVLWAGGDENAEAYFEEGVRLVGASERLTPVQKARFFESAAEDFGVRRLTVPVQRLVRDAAQLRAGVHVIDLNPVVAVVEEEESGD